MQPSQKDLDKHRSVGWFGSNLSGRTGGHVSGTAERSSSPTGATGPELDLDRWRVAAARRLGRPGPGITVRSHCGRLLLGEDWTGFSPARVLMSKPYKCLDVWTIWPKALVKKIRAGSAFIVTRSLNCAYATARLCGQAVRLRADEARRRATLQEDFRHPCPTGDFDETERPAALGSPQVKVTAAERNLWAD
jgi:hypothetical protein